MKIFDATEIEAQWQQSQSRNGNHLRESGPWVDDVDWYRLKYTEGYTHVRIAQGLFELTKRGPGGKVVE